MKIALTGGIACGKSLVEKYLGEYGIEVIDADEIVHTLIPNVAERKRIAAEVFADESKRRELEARLHPIVRERISQFLSAAPLGVIRVASIPLLFETGWNVEYDVICCVSSSRETQVTRMMTTRGYTRDEAEARLSAQLPVSEKAAKSNFVINNDGSVEDLHKETERFVKWLKNMTCSQTR